MTYFPGVGDSSVSCNKKNLSACRGKKKRAQTPHSAETTRRSKAKREEKRTAPRKEAKKSCQFQRHVPPTRPTDFAAANSQLSTYVTKKTFSDGRRPKRHRKRKLSKNTQNNMTGQYGKSLAIWLEGIRKDIKKRPRQARKEICHRFRVRFLHMTQIPRLQIKKRKKGIDCHVALTKKSGLLRSM